MFSPELSDAIKYIKENNFENPLSLKTVLSDKISLFINRCSDAKPLPLSSDDWFEMLACLHYIKKVLGKENKESTIASLQKHKPWINKDYISSAYDFLLTLY